MLKIQADSEIIIYCPAKLTTGGAELLHQLVHTLNVNHRNAFIAYYETENFKVIDAAIPSPYRKYTLKTKSFIEDKEDNVIVLNESVFNVSKRFVKSQLVFWWLSVDNFFINSYQHISVKDLLKFDFLSGLKFLGKKLKWSISKKQWTIDNSLSLEYLADLNALHCYQSEYAQNFLIRNGVKEMMPLQDYLNDSFFEKAPQSNKKNVILYNPKKGLSFTQKLIKLTPNIEWIPLQNMTREEMIDKLQTSKLYIDFGHHPGKDRIPREAAISGCCVITGLKGSARYFEDLSIGVDYKINETDSNINIIVDRIHDVIDNYEERSKDFDFYRMQIGLEKENFERQVKTIFQCW